MEDFKNAHSMLEPLVNTVVEAHTRVKWCAPPAGCLKANWDVAIDREAGRVGMGVVVRDCEGRVKAAKSLTKLGNIDPTMGEAMAAFQAVSLCQALGVPTLILEGDALRVVNALNSKDIDYSKMGHIVEDTRQLLQSIPQWSCCYVKRDANYVAHTLAKHATCQIIDRTWGEDIPVFICDIILMEHFALSS